MPIFVVEKVPQDEPAFRVLGPDGKPVGQIQEFLIYLANCGPVRLYHPLVRDRARPFLRLVA